MSRGSKSTLLAELQSHGGKTGPAVQARDDVNLPMIRHWCDAMGDDNPNYTDPVAGVAGPYGGLVAPPAMLNVWTMAGNVPRDLTGGDPVEDVIARLNEEGYVGVVATNCEHTYTRYLRLGDRLSAVRKLVEVSGKKETSLGVGHFVTTETEYLDDSGAAVGSMLFRVLKFIPGTGRLPAPGAALGETPKRPRPSMNSDSAWFWEGCQRRELRVQTFTDGTRVFPPMVRNPKTGEMPAETQWTIASGNASLYSYAVPHHPQAPGFDYPLVVGLVELEEGVRLVSNIVGCSRDQIEIGMALEVCWLQADDDVVLPQFRPARPPRRTTTLQYEQVSVGDSLPVCPIETTPTFIVAAAIASRDYQEIHHDRDVAQARGSKDIFMNILTSSGLAARYVGDWAGPDAEFKNLKLRLGAQHFPYDTLALTGWVTSKQIVGDIGVVTVTCQGLNRLGVHISGTVDLALPLGDDAKD